MVISVFFTDENNIFAGMVIELYLAEFVVKSLDCKSSCKIL
jgi:hypothetical protein